MIVQEPKPFIKMEDQPPKTQGDNMQDTTASHIPGYFTQQSSDGALAGAIGLAALNKVDPLTEASMEGICSLRSEVKDVGSNVRSDIGRAECSIMHKLGDMGCDILTKVGDAECELSKQAGDISHRSTIHLNTVQQDLNNRIHETREILGGRISDNTVRVIDRIDRDTEILRTQTEHFKAQTAENFCTVRAEAKEHLQKILEKMSDNKYDAIKNELDKERSDKYSERYAHQFAVNKQDNEYIKQMINSLEQRSSNRTTNLFSPGAITPTNQSPVSV